MPRIARADVFVFRAPVANPVRTSFGLMRDRAAVFLRLTDEAGAEGWGEIWCNFPNVTAEHRARLFHAFLAPRLLGRDIADPAAFFAETDRALHVWGLQSGEPGAFAAALAGADITLHDLAARRAGIPLWRHLGGTDAAPVPAYASGLNPGEEALRQVRGARAAGHTRFKIKIGFGDEADIATLDPVFADLRPGERVAVDVNQGWDPSRAARMFGRLARFPLAWVEEPVPADRPWDEWRALRAASAAPLAAGENLRGAAAFEAAIASGTLGVVQPDACKWGGLSATLPVARQVVAAGLSYCPHYLGGGVGLMASLHLLAAARGPGWLEVDVNPNPLRDEVVAGAFHLRGGDVALPAGPGLGVTPDLAALARHRVLELTATA
ncbi:MAG: mandelate racemase/muconate lactonizing enzyme family protein [Acetobacteraceae bacterium]|nr:mandelate racemase/muconate lactonizing enzyme family protein [Acetobacteraceae bacterium]